MMQKVKIAGVVILALIILIVVLQNTESVDTKILFITMTMPRAALLFGTLIVGFVLGIVTAGKMLNRKSKGKE